MFAKLGFYIQHSFNDLRVNGQRTVFALLCIAAGVAAIVSLQTLGVMIEDSLTGSLQESNRGDIRIYPSAESDIEEAVIERGEEEGITTTEGSFNITYFTSEGLDAIRTWFEERGAQVTYRQVITSLTSGQSVGIPEEETEKTFIMPYIVEADVYPFYGDVLTEDDEPLDELINEPTDIVISRNLADDLGAEVGHTVRVSGAREDFTLRGIIPTDAESGFENIAGALLGYYFIDVSAVDLFDDIGPGADLIYIRLEDTAELDTINEAFEREFPYLTTTTTEDLEEQNSEISKTLTQLVIIMGLVSLLIGGIGIVNTMLVIVSRRTTEVAVLKTIGLEGEQVTILFMVEAVIMGILGSLLGVLLGWIMAFAIKGVAETFLAQSLTFRITPTPAITGFVVGVIVTTIFGFMPTLAAGQVRPNLVLRPSDTVIPKAGRLRSFAALLIVMLALSLVAQVLIRDLLDVGGTLGEAYDDMIEQQDDTTTEPAELPDSVRDIRLFNIYTGLIGAVLGFILAIPMLIGGLMSGWTRGNILLRFIRWMLLLFGLPVLGLIFGYNIPAVLIILITFIIVGFLYVLLWVLIWLVGHFFPTLRIVDLKLALRSMLASKGRGASTLLALVVGVFTLSLITMLATAITDRFGEMLVDETGGNVMVLAAGRGETLEQVDERLSQLDGVNSYAAVGTYNIDFVSLHDTSENEDLSFDDLRDRIDNVDNGEGDLVEFLRYSLADVDAREVDSNLPDVQFYQGRQLNEGDTGPWNLEDGQYPPIIISGNFATIEAGIEVGDLLTVEIGSEGMIPGMSIQEPQQFTFEIVGMVDRQGANISAGASSQNYAPINAFPEEIEPSRISAIVDVNEENIPQLRRAMTEIPGVFVLETKLLNDLINRVINQFTSFPILVAGLALFTGGVVIANSVALSTLERRREIGIMKAVGLQRERVLGMLLLEYGLMGLIGGLIGVGIGALILLLLLTAMFQGELGSSLPYLTALGLMGLCVLIALVAAVITAWSASGEKPLNVLRYE